MVNKASGRFQFEQPHNAQQFEKMMMAIDAEMMRREIPASRRPIHVGRLLWEALGWEGSMFADEKLADAPGFTGEVLLAKVHRWFRHVYGEQLKEDGSIGWIPYIFGSSIWKVRLPVVFGTCRFFMDADLSNLGERGFSKGSSSSLNVISCIKDVTPGVLARVKTDDWLKFFSFYIVAFNMMNWLSAMRGCNALFAESINDYHASVNQLMDRHLSQSRWSSAQAAEKALKGVLMLAGVPFETRGATGHDISAIGAKVNEALGISLSGAMLRHAHCSPKIRYGEEISSEKQTLEANHATLGILAAIGTSTSLSRMSKVETMDDLPVIG